MSEAEEHERRLPAWIAPAATAVTLVAFVVVSAVQRWNVLATSPFPLGVDGYFYPVQLRALLETGELQYAASPLAFWLLAPFAAATDPITGAKLGAAVYGALIALPAYGVGAQLGRSRGAGLVASALATFSAGSAYLTIEFVKNGIGVTVALTALWLVLRALDRPSRDRIGLALVAVVLAVLAHKMAAALVVGIAVPAALAQVYGSLRGRRRLELALAIAACVVILLIVGLIAPRRFVSPGDARLVADLFSTEARWSLPVLVQPQGTLRLGYEPVIALVLALLAVGGLLATKPEGPRGHRVVVWIVIAFALVIALPWLAVGDGQGLGMRLRVVAFVPMAVCAAIAMRAALQLAKAGWIAHAATTAALLVVILAIRVPAERTEGRVVAHPAMLAGVHALANQLPTGAVAIVPERHIAFMIAWYTRTPISIRPEPVAIEQRVRVMPLAFIGIDSPLDRALREVRARTELAPPIGLHPRHPNGLVAVPEATWQFVLERLPAADRERFAAWPAL